MRHASRIGVVLWILSAAPLAATTFIVTNTNDSGAGSLRAAVDAANTNPGLDTIHFNIAGAGVHTIVLATPLADITSPVQIQGFTQPGSSANTNGPGLPDNSVHRIEIDGTNSGGGIAAGVFRIAAAANFIIDGLVINRAPGAAIQVNGATGTVSGCFLGTDATGMTTHANGFGVEFDGGSGSVQIGGTLPAQRNVISGNSGTQIGFGCWSGAGSTGHAIQGNFIGPNATGAEVPLPDPPGTNTGVTLCFGVTNMTIGGPTAAARNVISGNSFLGIRISNSFCGTCVTGIVVQGNYIGTDLTGTLPLGNGGQGININTGGNDVLGNVISGNGAEGVYFFSGLPADDGVVRGNKIGTDATGTLPLGNAGWGVRVFASGLQIGGAAAGQPNLIAFNGNTNQGGILIESGESNEIRSNSIHDNAGLGIDLGPPGVNGNDEGDGDTGPNGLQNFPVLESVGASLAEGSVHVHGRIHSAPSTTYQLDVFSNDACVRFPKDFLEGRTYLGTTPVTTDAFGEGPFNVTVPPLGPGERISMTATDPNGNTSEFSQRMAFSINPASGPAATATAVTIAGTDFEDGATVTIGGQPATSVVVTNFNQLTATTPALPAGSLNDVVVTNTQGTTGTLEKGYVADFLDVPPAQQFYSFVTKLVANAITKGIGGGLYGVDQPTLRQQMAVFLLKSKNGICYTPPPCNNPTFPDVPCSNPFSAWIYELVAQHITSGCGGGFCPFNPVTRQQMAVFLLKTLEGSGYTPPDCVTATFTDVPCTSGFAPWIYELVARNITVGCGNGQYCPLNVANRGQMATFLVKTFNLP